MLVTLRACTILRSLITTKHIRENSPERADNLIKNKANNSPVTVFRHNSPLEAKTSIIPDNSFNNEKNTSPTTGIDVNGVKAIQGAESEKPAMVTDAPLSGIPIEMLEDSVTDIFNPSLDLSAGVKVILRYFSSDWSRKNAKQPHYTHQVTYVQALKEANVSQNVNLPATAVEISTGLSGGVKKTSILSQKMGTDTLNYLMLRYNYLSDRKEEQSTWNNFINENKKNIMILMNNMSDAGKNSAHELNFILNEKIQSTDPSNHAGINEQFESIMENIRAVKEDKDKFDSALKGIEKLMDWHREETSRLSQSKLKPVEFSLPKNKFSSKLHF